VKNLGVEKLPSFSVRKPSGAGTVQSTEAFVNPRTGQWFMEAVPNAGGVAPLFFDMGIAKSPNAGAPYGVPSPTVKTAAPPKALASWGFVAPHWRQGNGTMVSIYANPPSGSTGNVSFMICMQSPPFDANQLGNSQNVGGAKPFFMAPNPDDLTAPWKKVYMTPMGQGIYNEGGVATKLYGASQQLDTNGKNLLAASGVAFGYTLDGVDHYVQTENHNTVPTPIP